jgi:hypothetical protein
MEKIKKVTVGGHRLERGLLSDPDKDGFPNPIDCNNLNPNKQGFVGHMFKKGLKKIPGVRAVVGEYESYKEGEPDRKKQRHEARMSKLQYRQEEEKERSGIEKLRAERMESRMGLQQKRMGLAERRTAMMEKRRKSMGSMPSLMGSMGPSLMGPKPIPKAPKPRRKSKKKK